MHKLLMVKISDKQKILFEVSCVMSVYQNDRAEWVSEAINSILNGTVCPGEFLIYCDGPITSDLELLLDALETKKNHRISIHKGSINRGRAFSRQYLIDKSTGSYIMIMDADDISVPDRLEKQYDYLNKNPEVDVLGGAIREFGDGIVSRVRKVPQDRISIAKRGKFFQPMNHVTILAKKEAILRVGGYIEAGTCEDYHLIARWLVSNVSMSNLSDILVNVRIDSDFINRRRGVRRFLDELNVARYLYGNRYISVLEFTFLIGAKFMGRNLPSPLLSLLYLVLRSPENPSMNLD